MKCRPRSRGFTLVELLIVTVLGTVVLLATLTILVSNQQTLTAVATKLRVYRTLRSGMGILAGELREISPATGDLLVMGGACQAGWEHSVPYLGAQSTVGPRISIQWRFARRTGRPFQGAGYRAPLFYSRERR